MGFDRLAPHYRWLEALLAGGKLQRCRTAWLDEVCAAGRILIAGEGNGRFLAEAARRLPTAHFVVLDASPAMLAQAAARLRAAGGDERRVEFEEADVLSWVPAASVRPFDLIVTHFFLDCFPPEELARVIAALAAAAAPRCDWLIADFRDPAGGPARWRARLILAGMYAFFRAVTGLRARRISNFAPELDRAGFTLASRRVTEWGLLHSDRWERR